MKLFKYILKNPVFGGLFIGFSLPTGARIFPGNLDILFIIYYTWYIIAFNKLLLYIYM